MKNCLILAVMLLGFWALYIAFHTAPSLADGRDFSRNCGRANIWYDLPCRSYVRGLVEGMAVAIHPAICFPDGFDSRASLPIVRRYIASHPGLEDIRSPQVVRSALRATYPCRGNSAMAPRNLGRDPPVPPRSGRDV